MPENKKSVVLFSGGQDSTTCLLWAIVHFGMENVQALGFDYGQKHAIEIEKAVEIATLLGIDYTVLNLRGVFGRSALTDHSLDTAGSHSIKRDLPATFTAGRNIVFLSIAGGFAFDNGAQNIVTGVCETDFSGYPDCRQAFISKMQSALQSGLDSYDLEIHTPLMLLDKAETWGLAKNLSKKLESKYDFSTFEMVRTMTMTDYNGSTKMNDWGMGELDNPASELRAKGYYKALEMGWL